jgi:hypothetical protein
MVGPGGEIGARSSANNDLHVDHRSATSASEDRPMKPRLGAVIAMVALSLLAAGCGGTKPAGPDPSIRVRAELPPSPDTWPHYPTFPASSCWTRPFGGGRPLEAAPSEPVESNPTPPGAKELVRRLVTRFGDRRFVKRIEIASPPPITLQHLRGYFAGVRPPADAVWAYVAAPAPKRPSEQMIAQWEAGLVVGALRDDFCAAGGAPLVGWSIGRGGIGLSDRAQALEQRFPNPSPAAFRARVALVGRRYGFTVDELRLLRPRQLAPLVVVRTDRDRKAFVHDVPAIMGLLDPVSNTRSGSAVTFEGFYFEAVDARGAFVRLENLDRGQSEGGQWSWDRCVYPYAHSEPAGAKPCP